MSSLVNWQNPYNPDRHSYDYYYNKIKKDKDTYGNVLPGDVYKKISNENIFKTLPGKQGAIYLIKKVTNEEGRWNKWRKRIGVAHGTISIKYERIKKNGNVPIYFDEKPLTANFYTWGQWKKDFKFVGKIWNVEGEPQQFYSKDYNIEFLEDIARRLAYEDPVNKDVDWVIKRKEKEWQEKKREWLKTDEGRRWRAEEAKRKERFLRLPGKAWRMSPPYFQTMIGKALYEENRRWGEEYDKEEEERKERERVRREGQEKRDKIKRLAEEARQRDREAEEEEARQKAEIERRERDEARREHLRRQAELWRRAEAVQRYLPVDWQYATEEQIEEAEREKEDEDFEASRGGNPNDSMDMLAIPKLKF